MDSDFSSDASSDNTAANASCGQNQNPGHCVNQRFTSGLFFEIRPTIVLDTSPIPPRAGVEPCDLNDDNESFIDVLRRRNSAKWKGIGYDPSRGRGDRKISYVHAANGARFSFPFLLGASRAISLASHPLPQLVRVHSSDGPRLRYRPLATGLPRISG
jgi:hypothetical protein